MPITLTAHPITSAFADRKTLDSSIVAATLTPGAKFRGIQVEVPFGKKGATQLRAECKTNGARWDGTTWMVPNTVYMLEPTKIEWFRSLGLLKAIVVSQYTDWKWDGNNTTDLIIDVPFDDRKCVKGVALWAPADRVWYVPAKGITANLVASLNRDQYIVGYRGSLLHTTAAVPAVVTTTQSTQAVPAQIDLVETIIAKNGLIVIEHFHQWIASMAKKNHQASELQCFHMNIHSPKDSAESYGHDGATVLFFLHSGADRAYTFLFNVGLVTNETVIQFINQMLGTPQNWNLPNGVPIIRSVKQHDVAQARAAFETLATAYSGNDSMGYSYRNLSMEFQSAYIMRTPSAYDPISANP